MKILLSPGYGAGWTTWSSGKSARFALTYQPIIDYIENGGDVEALRETYADLADDAKHSLLLQFQRDLKEHLGTDEDPYFYMGGADQLIVVDIPEGIQFRINEYDGSESLEIADDVDWQMAT